MSWNWVEIDGQNYLQFDCTIHAPMALGCEPYLPPGWLGPSSKDSRLQPADIIDRIDELVNDQLTRGIEGDFR